MLKTGGIKKILSSHQLGRRNLSPIQRIAVAEKYRPIYEKQAKERQATSTGGVKPQLTPNLVEGGDRRSKEYIRNQGVEKLPQVDFLKKERNQTTSEKLAAIAGVSEKTYRMGAKVLNSNNVAQEKCEKLFWTN